MTQPKLTKRLLQTTILAGAVGAAAAAATPAMAQDDEIVITGSRIERQDLAAPSPVSVVSAADLAIVNTINTEEYLNDLPQLIPSFDSTANNPGDGSARVQLRGLGPERTLVLVDGKRFVGEGITQIVDINNIPSALIERIDIVTGGASAVYGSDAMAGVVNFILKDDFEGVELQSSYRMTEQSDGEIFTTSATIGGNFDGGRGNAVVSLSYTDRKSVLQGDRDFSTNTFSDDGPGVPFSNFGSFNSLGGTIRPASGNSFGDLSSFDPDAAACATATCFAAYYDPNTSSYRQFVNNGPDNDRYNYAPTNYLQLPQERMNISAFTSYDITDTIQAYARGIYTNTVVDSQLAPTPTGTLTFNVDTNNPFLAQSNLGAIFADNLTPVADTDGDGVDEYVFRTNRRMTETGARNSLRDTNTYQVMLGLKGDVWDGWNWDVSALFGKSQVDQIQTGNLSIEATQDCILDAVCDIFNGDGSLSQEGADRISRTGAILETIEQTQLIGTLGGEFDEIKMPGADTPLAVVFGLEYREEYALQQPDSVLGPDVRGFNQSTFVEGRYSNADVFAEFELPLIEGAEFAQSVNLNGAFRLSDYSTVGSVESFAVGADWVPFDGLRLRSQFQRAVRAPNIEELFATASNGFPGVGDPCSDGSGFFDLLSADQQTAVTANCLADPNVTDPGAATPFTQINAQIETVFAGDPSTLEAEEADTFTVGAVWQPDQIDGLTVVVDYYQIEISNALGNPTAQEILDSCYIFGVSSACDLVVRDTAGTIDIIGGATSAAGVPVQVRNAVGLTVEGIDYDITYNWAPNWENGDFMFKFTGTHTLENSTQGSPEVSVFECAGTYSGLCGEPTPENKFTSSLTWMNGPLSATARYSWVGEVVDANGTNYGEYAASRRVSSIDAQGWLDLSGVYEVSENFTVQGGIRNVLDEEPPLLGDCCNEQANTWPATYETLGRQYFVSGTVKF